MNWHLALVVGVGLGLAGAGLEGCGGPASACDPAVCVGCCSSTGACVATSPTQCGLNGGACLACPTGAMCSLGTCVFPETGGSGGGSAGGSGGGSAGGTGGGSAGGTGGGSAGGSGGGSAGGSGGGSAGGSGGGSAGGSGGGSAGGTGALDGGMRLFVTSMAAVADLGGQTGADALCQSAAQGALLSGTWKAFLGGTATAPSRFADVGPWWQLRADGTAFKTFNNLANVSSTPLVAITLNERGESTSPRPVWTGVSGGGVTAASTCTGFASQVNYYAGEVGMTGTTTTSWSSSGTQLCDQLAGLYCFEQSHTPAAPTLGATFKRVFVTSVGYTGDLGGQTGADTKCTTVAAGAALGGTWKAYLGSTTVTAPAHVTDVGPWYQALSDGGMVRTFNNRSNLASTPLVPLTVNENGVALTPSPLWTGTAGGGITAASTCTGYAAAVNYYAGAIGTSGTNGPTWNANGTQLCDQLGHLVCLEQ